MNRLIYLLYKRKKNDSIKIIYSFITFQLFILFSGLFEKIKHLLKINPFTSPHYLKKIKIIEVQTYNNKHQIKNFNIPVHKLELVESKDVSLFFNLYNGIVVEDFKINKKSLHRIAGNNAFTIYKNYPITIFKNLLDADLSETITVDDNQKIVLCYNWFNYYHFITETVYKIVSIEGYKEYTFIFPVEIKGYSFVNEIIKILEINCLFLNTFNKSVFKFRKLFFVSEKPYCEEYDSNIISEIRQIFLSRLNLKKSKNLKLFISRKKNERRSMHNIEEIENVFRSKGFEIIYSEDYSFQRQVELFLNADFVAAIHGAGLTNILFMEEKSSILEIMPDTQGSNSHVSVVYQSLAKVLKLNYHMIFSDKSKQDFYSGLFTLDGSILIKKLDEIVR